MTASKVEASEKHALLLQIHDHSDVCRLAFSFAVALAISAVEQTPKWSDGLQAIDANLQTELYHLQPTQSVAARAGLTSYSTH